MLDGVCSIVQGLHPKVIERKLEAYVGGLVTTKKTGGEKPVRAEAAGVPATQA